MKQFLSALVLFAFAPGLAHATSVKTEACMALMHNYAWSEAELSKLMTEFRLGVKTVTSDDVAKAGKQRDTDQVTAEKCVDQL